jgi:hypothetical protein
VADAAGRVGKSVSAFVREAALSASARVTGKLSEPESGDGLPIRVLEPVRRRHMVTASGRAGTCREFVRQCLLLHSAKRSSGSRSRPQPRQHGDGRRRAIRQHHRSTCQEHANDGDESR